MRRLLTLAAVAGLGLAACGDDDDTAQTTAPAAATVTTAAGTPEATTPPPTSADATTAAPAPTSTLGGQVNDADAAAAALAWTTAFDSAKTFEDKAAFIADAEVLRPTIEAYAGAGDVVGGITLAPTDVVVDGDTATVTYDVLFAGQSPGYPPQTGTLTRVDGGWQVGREEFCGFMASARNPCPA